MGSNLPFIPILFDAQHIIFGFFKEILKNFLSPVAEWFSLKTSCQKIAEV